MELSDEQRLDWLRLIRSERIGPRTFRALVNQFGGAGAALDALPALARRTGRAALKITTRAEALREIEASARLGARFIALGEPDYPRTLLAIDTAPPLVSVRGDARILGRPTVAIVGSRNASAAGGTLAGRFAADLGREAYVIVSGLARGIDTRAHKAALATGTVAVLAGGHDRVYPSENKPLLEAIIGEGGAVVSEMPLGWEPRGRDFPRRNRIVSGLSYGVVVVEAARRSGSLITARFALEQGREVFAIPGSPLDPRAEGTNELIRAGATLCSSAEHVTAVLAPSLEKNLFGGVDGACPGLYREEPAGEYGAVARYWDELDMLDVEEAPAGPVEDLFDPGGSRTDETDRDLILRLLGATPVGVDDLARQSELPVRVVQLALVELELARRITRHEGHTVALAASASR